MLKQLCVCICLWVYCIMLLGYYTFLSRHMKFRQVMYTKLLVYIANYF